MIVGLTPLFNVHVTIALFLGKLILKYPALHRFIERSETIKMQNNQACQRSITSFDWKKSFQNKNINAKVEIVLPFY